MNKILEQFISLTREYISIIENVSSEINPHDFLSKCRMLLLQIYALGIQLPDTEPENTEISKTGYSLPVLSIGKLLGKYDMYNKVSDPIFDENIVTASISDDLVDIYRDLKDPLSDYDNNQRGNAIWSWKFNIQGHCGEHIVDSLRTIHRLVNNHMSTDYNSYDNNSCQ